MGISAQRQPVAVVGVSALFPGSTSAQGFWRDILAGRDLITEVPDKKKPAGPEMPGGAGGYGGDF